MSDKPKIRVWCIGPDGTEYYAAHSEEEMRRFYIEQVGKEQAEEDFAEGFDELTDAAMDFEIDFNDDGKLIKTTWRKVAERGVVPNQISTGYN